MAAMLGQASASRAGPISFDAPFALYETGGNPTQPRRRTLATADLNGDGRVDAVAASDIANAVSVFLGQADETFAPRVVYAAGDRPMAVTLADLDRDGRLDIVLAEVTSSAIVVLRGRGDGSFDPRVEFATGLFCNDLAVADVNGDGHLDVAAAGRDGFTILLGDGSGSLIRHADVPTDRLAAIAAGDVNGDGKADLVTGVYLGAGISLRLGNGDGAFADPIDYATGESPASLAIRDLNGDGLEDVVVVTEFASTVSVLRGRTDGTLDAGAVYPGFSPRPGSPEITDADGDGRLDLIVPIGGLDVVRVMRGNGDGTFVPAGDYGTGVEPGDASVGDVGGDGLLELLVSSDDLDVLRDNEDGTFGPGRFLTAGRSHWTLAAGDLNGDGRPDLAVARFLVGQGAVSVFLGAGDGTFAAPLQLATGARPQSLTIGDLDRDGRPDLVTADSAGVSVLLGTGGGAFAAATSWPAGTEPRSVDIGDLDGDGDPDLAVACRSSGSVSVLPGNGDGTFAPHIVLGGLDRPVAVAIADLNRDGHADLVATEPDIYRVAVFLGNGAGWASPVRYATPFVPGHPYAVVVVDLDRDGTLDLAVANLEGSVSVHHGRGDGTFFPETHHALQQYCYSLAVADLDGDTRPDLIVPNSERSTISVLRGRAAATFDPPVRFGSGRGPASVAVADFDIDGRPDIAVVNRNRSDVAVLLNTTTDFPTPVLLSLVSAGAEPGVARVVWHSSDPGARAVVERLDAAIGVWRVVATIEANGSGYLRHEDRDVAPGARYAYRLRLESVGAVEYSAPAWVTIPSGEGLALLGCRPNPAVRHLAVWFRLPDQAPARIEVLDTAGRRVRTHEVGPMGVGLHSLPIERDGLPPGVYRIRLTRGAQTLSTRAVLVD